MSSAHFASPAPAPWSAPATGDEQDGSDTSTTPAALPANVAMEEGRTVDTRTTVDTDLPQPAVHSAPLLFAIGTSLLTSAPAELPLRPSRSPYGRDTFVIYTDKKIGGGSHRLEGVTTHSDQSPKACSPPDGAQTRRQYWRTHRFKLLQFDKQRF